MKQIYPILFSVLKIKANNSTFPKAVSSLYVQDKITLKVSNSNWKLHLVLYVALSNNVKMPAQKSTFEALLWSDLFLKYSDSANKIQIFLWNKCCSVYKT